MAEVSWDGISTLLESCRYRDFIPPFIFEIAMPSDIPYNFRQSSSRDTITSPMIYDQSLPRGKRRSTNNDCGAASIKRRAQPGESHFMVITPGDPLIIWKALKRK